MGGFGDDNETQAGTDEKGRSMSAYYDQLFRHMADTHGLTLLDSELNEIVHIVLEMQRVALTTEASQDTTDAAEKEQHASNA